MLKTITAIHSCRQLLDAYQASTERLGWQAAGEKLHFAGVGDNDVYNITAPFQVEDRLILAGRVEGRHTEFSEVRFFIQDGEAWRHSDELPTLPLQDPFITRVHGEYVFGGVKVITNPKNSGEIISWVTEFYRGKTLDRLEHLATGPDRMKDIRLVELPDGGIGVFTRPQGEVGGRGKIGYIRIESLNELNAENMLKARIFQDQFLPEEWGGANEIHRLSNGLIGVLGHIACMDEKEKHYYAMTFIYDPETGNKTELKIIAARIAFPEGAAKREDLRDILFSGGLVRLQGGNAWLYVGVSDAEAHRLLIPDPFKGYEGNSF